MELNKVLHGDCLELLKDIPDNSIDMILCDLPYGTTSCKWDSIIPIDPLFTFYRKILKFNGSIVLTANQPFSTMLIHPNLDIFKYAWVWVKNRPTNPQNSKNRPMGIHEDILIFSKAPMGHVSQLGERRMVYNPQGIKKNKERIITKNNFSNINGERPNQIGKKYISYTGFPNTILNFNKEESHIHPTQKPVDLFEYLIRTYTNEGDLVLDNCGGSGTTAIAAIKSNRNYILMEKEQEYIDIINKRIYEQNCKKFMCSLCV